MCNFSGYDPLGCCCCSPITAVGTHAPVVFSCSKNETCYSSDVFASTEELIHEYKSDCAIVRKGVTSDIDKCLKEGKSLIVEGLHIDPRLYQKEIATHTASSSGIVVPFLLTIQESDHLNFMKNSPDPRYQSSEATEGFRNLQRVQSYLVAHTTEPDVLPFTEIAINLHSFHETLDLMHDIVLKRIEQVYMQQEQ